MTATRSIHVEVTAGDPSAFTIDGRHFRVKSVRETWSVTITSTKPQRDVQRTYYDVQTAGGQRAWLFFDHRLSKWGLEKPS